VKTYSYSLNAFAAWFIFSCFAGKLNGILQAGPLDPTSNAKMLLAGLARGVLRGFGSRRRPARPPRKRPCLYCGQNAAGSNIYAKAQLKLKNGRVKRSIGATAIVWLVTLAGCSSSPGPSASQQAALAKTELHFDLKACQALGAGLYKCPALDQPICNPDYNGQVQCVRIGPKGSVFVETPGAGQAAGRWLLEGPGFISNP
jgi:hypothetical protein